jgi:alpha-1,2-mannosyltransferase
VGRRLIQSGADAGGEFGARAVAGTAGLVALTTYLRSRLPEPAAHWPLWDVRVYQWAALKVVGGDPLYARSAPYHFTYPPFSAALFGIAGEAPAVYLKIAISLASVFSLLVLSALSLGAAGVRRRPDLVLAVAALALLLVPVVLTLHLGETDLIVTALVAADVLGRRDGGRLQGVGVGLAAAIKLTPLIFVVYLLATRRTRAAAVAVATFAITVAAGFLLLPGDSRTFWLGGVFLRSRRVGSAINLSDQSLAGVIARLAGGSGLVLLTVAAWHRRSFRIGLAAALTAIVFSADAALPSTWGPFGLGSVLSANAYVWCGVAVLVATAVFLYRSRGLRIS